MESFGGWLWKSEGLRRSSCCQWFIEYLETKNSAGPWLTRVRLTAVFCLEVLGIRKAPGRTSELTDRPQRVQVLLQGVRGPNHVNKSLYRSR